MKDLVKYLAENLRLDFPGEITIEQVRAYLREDDSRESRALLAKLGEDDDLRQSLQDALMNAENDFFNLVTTDLWESGQVHRRLRVAQILNDGDGDNRQGYAWQSFSTRLESGWSGLHGLTAPEIRSRLLADLTGPDADRRVLVAHVLGQMHELGLLMAARDAAGPGAEDARAMLAELTRPAHTDAPQ